MTRIVVIYETPFEYTSWTKLLYLLPIGLFIGAFVAAYYRELEGVIFLVVEGIFLALLFYFIMPRKLEIHQDKLRIVLGSPFAANIPLSTIREARKTSGSKAFVYSGVRFATSSKYVIEIVRNKGMNYVISPQNGELFLEQLNQAIKSNYSYAMKH